MSTLIISKDGGIMKKRLINRIVSIIVAVGFLMTSGAVEVQAANTIKQYNSASVDWSRFSSKYFRNQLRAKEAKLYDDLYDRCMQVLCGEDDINGNIGAVYTSLSDQDSIKVMFIFKCSNPQFFFLNSGYGSGYDKKRGSYCSLSTYRQFDSGSARNRAANRLLSSAANILNEIDSTNYNSVLSTNYYREKLIFDYMCDNVRYDLSSSMNQSCYSAIVNKTSVCAGISESFEMLCQYAGLDCVCVTSTSHEWNEVKIGNAWYVVDVTWAITSENKNDYYNKSTNNMLDGHTQEGFWLDYNVPYCDSDFIINDDINANNIGKDITCGIYVVEQNKDGIICGMVVDASTISNLKYRWLAYNCSNHTWRVIKDWSLKDPWLVWNPNQYGDYLILGQVCCLGDTNNVFESVITIAHHPYIAGICQMPDLGGGFLIGIGSYDNPNQSLFYEMTIYDCVLQRWVYTTGPVRVSKGNAFWTVWQPEYGFYWTLFRIYDSNGDLVDQKCFGFQNI